jgi:hypothetical protein
VIHKKKASTYSGLYLQFVKCHLDIVDPGPDFKHQGQLDSDVSIYPNVSCPEKYCLLDFLAGLPLNIFSNPPKFIFCFAMTAWYRRG